LEKAVIGLDITVLSNRLDYF